MRRYQEKFYFNPGDTGFKVWDTKFGRIGAAICWDQWFPETARCLALQGAEVGGASVAAWATGTAAAGQLDRGPHVFDSN
jgi:predicted amidohydrolase